MDLKEKKLFLLDMDGTIYLGNKLFSGTIPFLEAARNNGARCIFLTNNSSKSTADYVRKLNGMGIDCSRDDVFTSVEASAIYIKANHGAAKVYAAGTKAMVSELISLGIEATDDPDGSEEVVLQGFDTEMNYRKVDMACKLLEKGAAFLACNIDRVCPTEDGYMPDCGSICEMIKAATGRAPVFIGKPNASMINTVLKKAMMEPEYAVMVGDRLYTDIACGSNAGVDSVLVLSGETRREDLIKSEVTPTYVMEDIARLCDAVKRG